MGTKSHSVRLIAGRWRGRKLAFPEVPGLRPTGDRVRETLFNWLAPVVPGARCLDLFAGSGALGFEAASRGAAQVVMVDREPAVTQALEQARRTLAADGVEVRREDALQYLAGTGERFDVIFLDPPFADAALLQRAITAIEAAGCLAENGFIYLETDTSAPAPALPDNWSAFREKRAGQVSYRLMRYDNGRGAG